VTRRPPGLPSDARSACPIANALDALGDRWSLLVIRDLLFLKKLRYSELAASPESIPTNILADRLRRLEEAGIVEKKKYRLRPPRFEYHLTRKGVDLLPILREMAVWANRHIPGTIRPSKRFTDRGLPADPADGAR